MLLMLPPCQHRMLAQAPSALVLFARLRQSLRVLAGAVRVAARVTARVAAPEAAPEAAALATAASAPAAVVAALAAALAATRRAAPGAALAASRLLHRVVHPCRCLQTLWRRLPRRKRRIVRRKRGIVRGKSKHDRMRRLHPVPRQQLPLCRSHAESGTGVCWQLTGRSKLSRTHAGQLSVIVKTTAPRSAAGTSLCRGRAELWWTWLLRNTQQHPLHLLSVVAAALT